MRGVIGEPLTRVDGRLKVTGLAAYTADHNIPGLTHGVLVTSTIAKGQISSIDTEEAERVPGVLAVLTHNTRLPVAKDPMDATGATPAHRALQLLQNDRIYYANQPVAIAIAETFEAAMEAAGRVKTTYAVDHHSVGLENALARSYIPKKAGSEPAESKRGDVERGLADAEVRLEHVYGTQFQTHNPMEPHATIAVWEDPGSEHPRQLTVYDSSQGIFGARKRIAELTGLNPANIRVVALFVGGGFGSKGPVWSHTALCVMAARHVRRPLKLVLRRQQMFGPVGFRSETRQTITAGARRDGTLTALTNDTMSHTSTFDEFAESATLPSRMLYETPNNRTVQRLVRSDIGTPSYTRAPGEAPGSFALEVAMDELACELKMDPVALRLKNYAERDPDKELPWSSKMLRQCYEQGAERFGWRKRPSAPRSMRDGHSLVGWGMATSLFPANRSPASARARMNPDGSVIVEAGSQELGGGTYTIMTQIAAAALGVPAGSVRFRLGDTRYPETPVSGGSQTAASTGTAVHMAALALRDKITQMGKVGERLQDIVARGGQPVEAEASSKPNEERKKFSMYSFGAQFAEVRVDADLGQLFVSRMVGVFGAGKILNSKTGRSQFLGGMVWGIGLALHEDTIYDERLGRIVNNNYAEYHVPVNADVGNIDVSWIDEDDRHVMPVGAKGIGEIGITGAAAAIANAVYHATGKRIRELPIRLENLL